MAVKFIKNILEARNLTAYGAAKWLNMPAQLVDHALKKGESIHVKTLCKWRYISGLTWNQFGKLLDNEFLEAKDLRSLEDNRPADKPKRGPKPKGDQ